MTFLPRIVVLSLATYGAVNLFASLLLLVAGRRLLSPRGRSAGVMLALRALPAALSLLATAITALSLARFEPRGGTENPGALLVVLATLAALIAVRTLGVAIAAPARTWRLTRAWTTGSRPVAMPGLRMAALMVESAFPVVAVIGVLRPKMIVARCVLNACPADELAAVAAHEAHHARARDNARRLVVAALPDLVSWLPAGRRFRRRWHWAAERDADEAAARSRPSGHLDLARALIRIARLAPLSGALQAPGSAFHGGEPIERRVRRLLARAAPDFPRRPSARCPAGGARPAKGGHEASARS